MPRFTDVDNDPSFLAATGQTPDQIQQAGTAGIYGVATGQTPDQIQQAGASGTAGMVSWSPGQGRITPEQVTAQYGADPSVAQYWADKINTGGDPNYYIGRLQQDNSGSGPDGKGGVSGGGGFGGAFGGSGAPAKDFGPMPSFSGGPTSSGIAIPAYTGYQAFDPSKVDVNSDPGVAFRLAQDEAAFQRSAAAKGTLLTGGSVKDLSDYMQGNASQEYGNAFNRAFQTNQANNSNNLAAWQGNTNARLGVGQLDLGNRQASNSFALGQQGNWIQNKNADQSYDLGVRNNQLGWGNLGLGYGQLGLGYETAGNQNALGWANYGLNANQQNFGQAFDLSQMGLSAANSLNGAAGQYGSNASNTYAGIGNAQGGAAIGAGNAWSNAFSNAGNAAMGGYYMNHFLNSGAPRGYGW